MLDINLFRTDRGVDLELVKASQRKRFADESVVDRVAELDAAWRQASYEREQAARAFNAANKEVAALRKAGKDASGAQAKAQQLKAAVTEAEAREAGAARARDGVLGTLGNLVGEEVPVHNDEAHNAVVRVVVCGSGLRGAPGSAPEPHPLAPHPALLAAAGIADLESGTAAAGARGYYLLNEGVLLNQALISYGLSFLGARGWAPVQTPAWINGELMGACAQLSQFDDELYRVVGNEDPSQPASGSKLDGADANPHLNQRYLVATSEQALCAMLAGAWVEGGDLPIKYAGLSPCFRREAGSHGRDTLGVFRVHQFDKVEQFGVTPPDPKASAAMLDDMLTNASDFYSSLGVPHRLVRIVSGALNMSAASKVDLEAWFPASQTYRELVSGSNCTDYQARRLNIRLRPPSIPHSGTSKHSKATAAAPPTPPAAGPGSSPGGGLPPSPFVHMLNCTLTATQRTMCAIMENHQTHEGFWVPAPLRPFMGGQDFVKFRRPLTAPAGRLLLSALKHSRGGRG